MLRGTNLVFVIFNLVFELIISSSSKYICLKQNVSRIETAVGRVGSVFCIKLCV